MCNFAPMKKWLFNLFLASCVLVFASFGKYDSFAQVNDAAPSGQAVYTGVSFTMADGHIKAPVVSTLSNIKITLDNYDNENKEDKPDSSKKDSASGAYFTNFYTAPVSGYYCQHCRTSLRYGEQVQNSLTSKRYLTLGVLRI